MATRLPLPESSTSKDCPSDYQALLVVSFGGPERREDVIPFLENVLRGKNVPRERMLEVAEHYYHFNGVSPINSQNRELIEALESELTSAGIRLPIFWGNRNWSPFLTDALRAMRERGITRALAYFTSAYSSYSGCRQYRENIAAAQQEVAADGKGPAPEIHKIRNFYNHPGFIAAMSQRLQEAIASLPIQARSRAVVAFTAHSIPLSMAQSCRYEAQLREACELVSQFAGLKKWRLCYQSRSGPPSQPWLEPDIGDVLREMSESGVSSVVIAPIGFLSDHLEVLYDLDVEAAQICRDVDLEMVRCPTVGVHPRFVTIIRELIEERLSGFEPRLALGSQGPSPDVCALDCCPPPVRPRVS